MLLVYIENYSLLTKIIGYLDEAKIRFTTDIKEYHNCHSMLIQTSTSKGINLINMMKNKKIIYLLYDEELKIYKNIKKYNQNSLTYKSKLYNKLNCCSSIITSHIYFKNILKGKYKGKFYIIPYENKEIITKNSLLKLYKIYKLNKKKTIITIIDKDYKLVNFIYDYANKYNNINIVYIGYKQEEYLNKNEQEKLNSMPKNIIKKYCTNPKDFEEIIRLSKVVIFNDNILEYFDYLNIIILLNKQLIIKNSDLCDKYFINSKNCYLYNNDEELSKKLEKYLKGDIGNLTYNTSKLIENNNYKEIINFIKKIFN